MAEAGADPTILVCRCGRPLRLAGATPGRIGRCPACGETFRVPGRPEGPKPPVHASEPKPSVTPAQSAPPSRDPGPARPRPTLKPAGPRPEAGYDLGPGGNGGEDDDATAFQDHRLERVAPRSRSVLSDGAIDSRGLVRRPLKPEKSAFASLLYPIWDPKGVAWLVCMPPILTAISLVVFGGMPIVLAGGVASLFLPFVCSTIAFLAIALARLLQGLSAMLIASAEGDVHHPPGADVDFGDLFLTILRWGLAGGLGVGLMTFPALGYYQSQPEPGLIHRLLAVAIAATGGIYSLMALLSVELHNDLLGLKPSLVLGGAIRAGLGYVQTLAAFFGAVLIGTLIVSGIYRLSSLVLIFLATWAAWIYAQYAAMAIMRLLGRSYHRRRKQIGWFEVRRRASERPLGPPPPPVPDL